MTDFETDHLEESYMTRKISLVLFSLLIISLLLTACERPASIAPVTAPTSSSEIPFPVATQSDIMRDILAATQTAAFIQGTLSTGGLTGATSTSAFTLVTPTVQTVGGTVVSTSAYATSTPAATSTPTPIVYPTPTPGIPGSYTLHQGEFPYCIARRFNVDPAALLSANGLNMYSMVPAGTKLTIPQGSKWPGDRALKSHPTTYTVAYGDTVYTIACAFGDADPNTILAANGLAEGATLTSGQSLYIP
jgi:LysM repeat protein